MSAAEPTVLGEVEAHRLFLKVMENSRTTFSMLHKRLSREPEIDVTISTRNLFRHYVKLAATLAEWRELRSWFLGPDCAAYCEMLQLNVERVRESVATYSNLPYNARMFASLLAASIKVAEERFGPASEVGANGA